MDVSHDYTKPKFKAFMTNGVSDSFLKKLFEMEGHTHSDTEKYMGSLIKEMIIKINKSKK